MDLCHTHLAHVLASVIRSVTIIIIMKTPDFMRTAGLVAGVFLLGYGLVEIPRGMWNQANPEERLRSACYRCVHIELQ